MNHCRLTLVALVLTCVHAPIVATVAEIRGDPCDISGTVVDESGQFLQEVQLEIVATTLVDWEPVESRTNILVNGSFTFQSPIVAEMSLIARKDGYTVGTAYIGRRELAAKDIVIRLLAAPPLTRLVEVVEAEIRLEYNGSGYGLFLESGKISPVVQRPDLFLQFSSNACPDSKEQPTSVDLYIASGGGIQCVAKSQDRYANFTSHNVVEAPLGGYENYIKVSLPDDARHLICFRTPAGLYGKLDLGNVRLFHDRQELVVRGRYFYQPDGSRNLNNGERLKLIRAKRAK